MTDFPRTMAAEAARKLRIISTDFDGTIYSEFESEPICKEVELVLSSLQSGGSVWVINTGRDYSSLMNAIAKTEMRARPDYLVVVEREIYELKKEGYLPWQDWNQECARSHRQLFARVRKDLPDLTAWVTTRYEATIYEDPFSPFCLVGANNQDTDAIQNYLETYCGTIPGLTVVRNDIYIRFSHQDYNKGTALSAIAKRRGVPATDVVAAGDHLNDLPMLRKEHAHWLIAPANAVAEVKTVVEEQQGYVSSQPCGLGVTRGLETFFERLTGGGTAKGRKRAPDRKLST